MLAKVKCHTELKRSLMYSEVKLSTGKAECLAAVNFIKDAAGLSTEDKLGRFQQRTSLHERAKCNTVHISLNFSSKDDISNEKMVTMANYYMDAIGFGRQPYLVYRHHDTNHPHLHVLSTNITGEGKRIQLHGIVHGLSRAVVREMEVKFSLTRNERASNEESFKTSHAYQVVHGEQGIKRGISDVLYTVIPQYNYTSFQELNAILRLYNVAAHRGEEGSHLHTVKGLLYYALNDKGERTSLPLKASKFLLKPTLANLEKRFSENLAARAKLEQNIDTYADWILETRKPTWEGFRSAMENEGVSVVVQADKKGGGDSVFFVDHARKYAYAGESLGPGYGLQPLRERCSLEERQEEGLRQRLSLRL